MVVPVLSGAQTFTSNMVFNHVNDKNGLQSNQVTAITQDYRGMVWFGTENGLYSFDGYSVNSFLYSATDSLSLSGNTVQTIFNDRDNKLWIGTNYGVCIYNERKNNFIRIPYSTTYFTSYYITDMDQSSSGEMVFCSPSMILKYNAKTHRLDNYLYIADMPEAVQGEKFTRLFFDSSNKLWVASQFHLYEVDFPDNKYKVTGHSCGVIHKISDGSPGQYYLSTANGLFVFRPADVSIERFDRYDIGNAASPEVWDTKPDNLGNLWIGTNNSGLVKYSFQNSTTEKFSYNENTSKSIGNNNIRSIYTDQQGIIWVGTQYNGASYSFIQGYKKFRLLRSGVPGNSLTSNIISAICRDSDGNLWLGTDGNGLNKIEASTGRIENYYYNPANPKGISTNAVLAIFEDNDKNLWIGGYNGPICRYNKKDDSWKWYDVQVNESTMTRNDVRKFFQDSKGRLWVCTNGRGLLLYNKQLERFIAYTTSNSGLLDDYLLTMAEDKQNRLWVGGYYGACIFNPDSVNEKHNFLFDADDSSTISHNWVYCIYCDSQGTVWLGTAAGLDRYNPVNDKFERFSGNSRFASEEIFGMLENEHDHCLWICSSKGLTKLNPQSKTLDNFDQDDGLPTDIFIKGATFKGPDGEFYFGTAEGVVSFSPDEIVVDTFAPPILITDIMVFYKSIGSAADTVYRFNSKETTLTFKYAGLNYIVNFSNQFSYKLEGYDEDWNNVGNRHEATYTNLSPGKYRFLVRVTNRDGYGDRKTDSVSFVILPPWYKTIWFRAGLILLVVMFLFVVYKIRIYQVNLQKIQLENLVRMRTLELESKNEQLNDANSLLTQRQSKIEIQTRELLEVNDKLNELNAMKDKFFSIIAHDLKNPFSTILGFSEILRTSHRTFTEEEMDRYTNLIYESTRKVFDLLDNLLLWSRSQQNRVEFEPYKFDINDCIEKSVEFYRELFQNKKIDVQYAKSGEYFVFADFNMINTVVRNLLSNAMKFTPENGRIEIGLETEDHAVVCKVSDNGVGMENEVLESLFKPEAKQSTSGTLGETGTGLGLVICEDFIKKNNGRIWCESTPGKGTTFYFSLPGKKHDVKPN